MNVRVGRIARWQAAMGGFAPEPTPSPPHLVASDSDGDDDDASDDDRALPMRCLLDTLPFVTRDKKREVVLDMRVVTLRGRVSFWDHYVSGSVVIFFLFEGCSEDIIYLSFSFLSFLDALLLYMSSCDHL